MDPKMLAAEAADFLNISLQALHKQLKTKQLDFTKSQNRVYFGHETAKKIFKLQFKPTCWNWLNLKGGVGKTQLSFSTAVRLSLYGAKVAVIDLDQQGNFTQACNVNSDEADILIDVIKDDLNIKDCMINVIPGLDLLPSRIDNALLDSFITINRMNIGTKIKKYVDELKKHYDFVFIDCPPSLGATVSSASCAADFIIIPVDPEKFSISGLNVTIQELERSVLREYSAHYELKIVLNKFDGRTSLSRQILTKFYEDKDYREKMLQTFVRTTQDLPNAIVRGKTIYDTLRTSVAREDIDFLAREILEFSSAVPCTKKETLADTEAV